MKKMINEIKEIPYVIERQLREYRSLIMNIVDKIKQSDFKFITVLGRGSSDNIGLFLKYLFEINMGIPVIQATPSVITLYKSKLNLKESLLITISQSGQSSDLYKFVEFANDLGATTITITNDQNSPIANISNYLIPMFAGSEKAVAATKTFVASSFASLYLNYTMRADNKHIEKLYSLPDVISDVIEMKIDDSFIELTKIKNAYVIGRGYLLPFALEAALKLKEVCNIHGEGYSASELLHGPLALIGKDFPIIYFCVDDATKEQTKKTIEYVNKIKPLAYMLTTSRDSFQVDEKYSHILKSVNEPEVDPLILITFFYRIVYKIAVEKGLDPDNPPFITKVTNTL
ncbi:MAG: SIS domain-containing protein [Deferribacterota bacterium]|nr:SIS domain-containing protein [Deferribacterota bacterium]